VTCRLHRSSPGLKRRDDRAFRPAGTRLTGPPVRTGTVSPPARGLTRRSSPTKWGGSGAPDCIAFTDPAGMAKRRFPEHPDQAKARANLVHSDGM